jgi:predicted transglutaminase-like cysteine proteinase
VLLAAAMTETGEGHLVLVVSTGQGEFVLDNRQTDVVEWSRLPYRWLSRQSQVNPASWLSVLPRAG